MNLLRWFRKERQPSDETEVARRRLERVHKDDQHIKEIIRRREAILKENHLGPAIARALRGDK